MKTLLQCCALLSLLACKQETKQPDSASAQPPNIIVVLVDDMRWDEYGQAGHAYIQTPYIDRIAKEGISFLNAFTTTPLCSPSRASFLTGQYAHTNGIIDNTARNEQSNKLETFPKILNGSGYETAFIGKWHMGNDDSPRPGFDQWVALKGQGEAINPGLNINGEQKIIDGYVTDILTDYALSFIQKNRSKPFLLYLSHKALHPNAFQADDGSVIDLEGGFVAADRHKGMYDSAFFQRRPNNGIPPLDKPALMRKIGDLPPLGIETATREKTIRERGEMLMAVDEGLGEMIDALSEMDQLNNTIIVVTSDHGYWYGEHGLNEERRLAYEEAIRIPMLIRYPPKIKAATTSDQTILSIDLAPTLLAFAGVAIPETVEGKSLIPVIDNQVETFRPEILIEYYSDIVFPRMYKMGYKAIRTNQYKYIRYNDLTGMDEFYDLKNDPYELKNEINNPGMKPVIDEMKKSLNQLITK